MSDFQSQFAPEIPVEDFPDNPSDYRMDSNEAAILVRYRGRKANQDQTMGLQTQMVKRVFEITIMTRDLNGPLGAYLLLEGAHDALYGKQYAHSTKAREVSSGFVSRSGSLWRHEIILELDGFIVAAPITQTFTPLKTTQITGATCD